MDEKTTLLKEVILKKGKRKYSDARKRELLLIYEKYDKSLKEFCLENKLQYQTFWKWLQKASDPDKGRVRKDMKPRSTYPVQKKKEYVKKFEASGLTHTAFSKQINVNKNTVSTWATKYKSKKTNPKIKTTKTKVKPAAKYNDDSLLESIIKKQKEEIKTLKQLIDYLLKNKEI